MPRKGPPPQLGGAGTQPNPALQNSFVVTASGTFNKDDFKVKATGIEQTPSGAGKVSTLQMSDLELEEGTLGGRGASGNVRRAFHRPTSRVIALKSINVHDKSKRDQLMTELKVLMGANKACPYLVQFYDAFWADPFIHLAIEFMDEGSLDVVLRKCCAPDEECVSVMMRQLLQGLHFLHKERHNLHRDLKPGNVLLSSNGIVKVADFGISREMDNTMAYAATFTGTAIYMSPERMQGKPYSFPSDVWAVGLIATECVLGRYPYNIRPDMKYFDLVMTIVNQPAPTPGEQYSAEFNEFVSTALSKQEQMRANCEA
eukprot:CAMPEP_0181317590 /NCGR_PEP_ID=MMETSP1101-20121128/16552_1 /TAXON_ID=46948 /ORGANISM="Rhodomonas abbreviata, Strain Caron Lab Isolate" /LENGTH=314 /DNA_ID=CAMNT_0023424999 /DNA_START=564 /DNA_END=1505 /DNA_ORIENTATION=-